MHAAPGKVENVTATVMLSAAGSTIGFSFQVSKQQKMTCIGKVACVIANFLCITLTVVCLLFAQNTDGDILFGSVVVPDTLDAHRQCNIWSTSTGAHVALSL